MSEQIENNHTRRWFLTKVWSYALSWVVSSSVWWIIAPSGILMIWSIFSDKENEDLAIKNSENKFVYLRTRDSQFVNIGVRHIPEYLETQLHETFMGKSIEEADIILLEKWWEYFPELEKHCIDKWKRVQNMDMSHGNISDIFGMGATTLSALGIFDLYTRDVMQLGNIWDPEEKKKIRLQYIQQCLSLLWIAQLWIFPPSLIASIILSWENEYKAQYDISHTWDARTVFMAIQVLKTMKENPGKKVLAISGDFHARWIHYYLYEAEGQREFKNIIYNIIYGIFKLLP